jgi:GH24 family phage-related lysozyme (muramidase)
MNLQNLLNYIKKHEGFKLSAYKDTKGIWTIGVGFNLQQPGADGLLNLANAPSSQELISGTQLTDSQVDSLLALTVNSSILSAKKIFNNFNTLSDNQQMVLVDLTFNLGAHTLSQFTTFIGLIEQSKFAEASSDILTTAYAKQVPSRAKENASLLLS